MGKWSLPGYRELTLLGEGGFGRVVLARWEATGEVVAIKYLLAGGDRAQFRHEAAILRRVVSPYVARLYTFVETPAGAAIVMEAVPGVSLRAVLDESPVLAPESALVLLKGSLLGLAAAHAVGTVHRDYKPGNVLVAPNRQSKLVDFGIALLAGHGGHSGGTPAYMAPEQWQGGPATPATDVYAATCVFFQCVAGARPFEGATTEELRELHRWAAVPVERAPEAVRGLVARGMAKAVADRPAGAGAFVRELEAVARAGYGRRWEEAGWQRLAGFAGVLLAMSPMAWVVSATGVLGPAAGFVVGGVAGGSVLGAAGGGAAGGSVAGGAAGGSALAASGSAGAAGGVGAAGGGAAGTAGAATGSSVAGGAAGGSALAASGSAGGVAAIGGGAASTAGVAAGSSATTGAGAAGSATAIGGGAAGTAGVAASSTATTGVGAAGGATAAGVANAAAGSVAGGLGGALASGAAGAGVLTSTGSAVTAVVAAKVAAVVLAVAVVVGAVVVITNTVGDETPAAALAVDVRTARASYDVNLDVTADIVQVSGHPDPAIEERIDRALQEPVNTEVNELRTSVDSLRDLLADEPRADTPVATTIEASVLLQNDNFVSVRYENQPVSDLITNSSWQSFATVTVDLRTGDTVGQIIRPGLGTDQAMDMLERSLVDHSPDGLCDFDLAPADLGENLLYAFTPDHVEFTVVLPLLGAENACGIPTVQVPYDDLAGLLDPDLVVGLTVE
jgi:hypothetical protein